MSDFKIEVFRPFGPSIAKIQIPENIVGKLNDYVDKIIIDEKKSEELDNGKKLAGNVKQEFRLENDFIQSSGFLNILSSGASKWINVTENKQISKFNLLSSWIVRQFESEYNPAHYHGGHISGVGYLKIPESFGKTFQPNKKHNLNGNLSLIHGNRIFNSSAIFKIVPKVGEFYFFPNYMIHMVYPFYGKGERRSISFNATIDEEIYNVYGN
jgi:hypothetical protein